MTSETPNLHVSKNLNISKMKQDIEKLKTPIRLVYENLVLMRIKFLNSDQRFFVAGALEHSKFASYSPHKSAAVE